jgi:hypothetical protein
VGSCIGLSRHAGKAKPARLSLAIAAILLVLWGFDVSAEDEPGARAPLPPPLNSVSTQVDERAIDVPASGHRNPTPVRPTITANPSHPRLSQMKSRRQAAPRQGPVSVERKPPPVSVKTSKMSGQRRSHGRSTVTSGTKQKRDRFPAGPAVGVLSPPTVYSTAGVGGLAEIPGRSRHAPPLYYPDRLAVPPAYGYVPNYPFAWAPTGPMMFR